MTLDADYNPKEKAMEVKLKVTNVPKTDKIKMVYLGTVIPEECMKAAQVMIVDGDMWHLIVPGQRAHGTTEMKPTVTCPVVDISAVKNDSGMRAVMAQYTDQNEGVVNLAGLLTGLEALGGKVTPAPLSQSTATSPQIASNLGGEKKNIVDVAAAWREKKEGRIARRVQAHRKVKVH